MFHRQSRKHYWFSIIFTTVACILLSFLVQSKQETPLAISENFGKIPSYSKQSDYVPSPPRCGEVHNALTGGVFYKPFETIQENERCVWIIGVSGAVAYTINVQYLHDKTNQPGSNQELLISGVQYGVYYVQPAEFTNYIPTTTGEFNVTDSNIVIITFSTAAFNDPSRTGFALEYAAILTGNISETSALSTHHLFQSPTFEFKYPAQGRFSSRELAAFVFPVTNNFFVPTAKCVMYRKISFGDQPSDVGLYPYNFNFTSGMWESTEKIGSGVGSKLFTYDDTLLILFKTNIGGGDGFYLAHALC